jgi:hypothetical protein
MLRGHVRLQATPVARSVAPIVQGAHVACSPRRRGSPLLPCLHVIATFASPWGTGSAGFVPYGPAGLLVRPAVPTRVQTVCYRHMGVSCATGDQLAPQGVSACKLAKGRCISEAKQKACPNDMAISLRLGKVRTEALCFTGHERCPSKDMDRGWRAP